MGAAAGRFVGVGFVMTQQQSPIFAKTETLMVWMLDHTSKFPKHERFRLAKWIDDSLSAFHEAIIRAAQQSDKIPHLQEAKVQLQRLRTYMRLAMELHYTSYGQYGFAAQQTSELGKLLSGWLKKA